MLCICHDNCIHCSNSHIIQMIFILYDHFDTFELMTLLNLFQPADKTCHDTSEFELRPNLMLDNCTYQSEPGSVCTFICSPGYTLSVTRTCTSRCWRSYWSGMEVTCDRKFLTIRCTNNQYLHSAFLIKGTKRSQNQNIQNNRNCIQIQNKNN